MDWPDTVTDVVSQDLREPRTHERHGDESLGCQRSGAQSRAAPAPQDVPIPRSPPSRRRGTESLQHNAFRTMRATASPEAGEGRGDGCQRGGVLRDAFTEWARRAPSTEPPPLRWRAAHHGVGAPRHASTTPPRGPTIAVDEQILLRPVAGDGLFGPIRRQSLGGRRGGGRAAHVLWAFAPDLVFVAHRRRWRSLHIGAVRAQPRARRVPHVPSARRRRRGRRQAVRVRLPHRDVRLPHGTDLHTPSGRRSRYPGHMPLLRQALHVGVLPLNASPRPRVLDARAGWPRS